MPADLSVLLDQLKGLAAAEPTPGHWQASGAGSPSVVIALAEVAAAGEDTGWREVDGRCWCFESREDTGAEFHVPRCQRMRDALARLLPVLAGEETTDA